MKKWERGTETVSFEKCTHGPAGKEIPAVSALNLTFFTFYVIYRAESQSGLTQEVL